MGAGGLALGGVNCHLRSSRTTACGSQEQSSTFPESRAVGMSYPGSTDSGSSVTAQCVAEIQVPMYFVSTSFFLENIHEDLVCN